MYEFESQVRYSESLHTGKMDIISISNYLQDCATFHSTSIGKDISYYKEIDRGWFLNSWQIDMHRYPEYGEKISVATWSYGIKGFYGYRNFTIRDTKGALCACANSIWFFADTATGQPMRVPQEEADAYGSEKKFPMEYCSRKISLPEHMHPLSAYTTEHCDIDTNGHVNNVRYISLAFQHLPEKIQHSDSIWRLRAEYKKAAKTGDIIYPYKAEKKRKIRNKNFITSILPLKIHPNIPQGMQTLCSIPEKEMRTDYAKFRNSTNTYHFKTD